MMTTNYERYFGTPERAARSVDEWTQQQHMCSTGRITCECRKCQFPCGFEDDIREWLEEESETD